MITAVDTNVLLDILLPGAPHVSASKRLLDQALQQGALVVNEVVYAELASQFPDGAFLERFLGDTGIKLDGTGPQGLQVAAGAWQRYRDRREDAIQCPKCGHRHLVHCQNCGQVLRVRQHILADFLIGGHAVAHADVLLSRDRGFYRNYFPELEVLPSSAAIA